MDTATAEPSTSTEATQNQRDIKLAILVDDDTATNEIEIKKSRFIVWIARTDGEGSTQEVISLARAEYPGVRHHCSVYTHEVIGGSRVKRSSDDGKPGGTVGRPMLNVPQGSGTTNVTAVVTRYFGGIKLGVSGLVRTYSDSVSKCLEKATRMRRA